MGRRLSAPSLTTKPFIVAFDDVWAMPRSSTRRGWGGNDGEARAPPRDELYATLVDHRMAIVLDRDPTLVATWEAWNNDLHASLKAGDLASAVALVDAVGADSWLGVADSSFHPLAAVALLNAGHPERALAMVREARRFGFPRFWLFDGAWGSHGIARDASGTYSLDGQPIDGRAGFEDHALLRPLYEDPAIAAFVRDHFRAHDPDYAGTLHGRPFAWGELAVLERKRAKCAATGRVLSKGADVYRLRRFNGAYDIPTDFVVVSPEAFDAQPALAANRRKFETDGYELADFDVHVAYDVPEVNAFWFDRERRSLEEGLRVVAEARVFPTPWALFDSEGHRTHVQPSHVFAGSGGELVDLLWVLVKCGALPEIVRRLPQLPAELAILLLLFDRPALRAQVAAFLGEPELVAIVELATRPRLTAADRAALVRYGREHPRFRALLAAAMRRYEFHLYSNYECSPNWFFQDFHHLVRGRGRHFLYLLASQPDLLEPLATMRRTEGVLDRPDTSVSGIAYRDLRPTLLEVLSLGEEGAAPSRATKRKESAKESDPSDEANRWTALAKAAVSRWLAEKQIELEHGGAAAFIDDLADVLSCGIEADALEEFVVDHKRVSDVYATGAELMRAVREAAR